MQELQEIIKRGPQPNDPNLIYPTGTLDIEEAIRIIGIVVDQHENGLPQVPTIETVAGLPRELVAEAATTVCVHLLGGMDSNNYLLSASDTKRTPFGHMILQLEFANPRRTPEETPKPRSIDLRIFNPDSQEDRIGTRFPLVLVTDPFRLMSYYYMNPEEGNYVSLVNNGRPEPLSMEQRRKIRRGTRWLFANMLNWGSEPIYPAQLDLPAVPNVDIPQSLQGKTV